MAIFSGSQKIKELFVDSQKMKEAHIWTGSSWQKVFSSWSGPSVISNVVSSANSGTSLIVNLPTDAVTGDMIVIAISSYGPFSATPSGWTLIQRAVNSNHYCTMFFRIKQASDSNTLTITGFDATYASKIAMAMRIKPGSTLNASTQATSAATSPVVVPAVTTTQTNTLILRATGFTDPSTSNRYASWSSVDVTTVNAELIGPIHNGFCAHLLVGYELAAVVGAQPARQVALVGSNAIYSSISAAIK